MSMLYIFIVLVIVSVIDNTALSTEVEPTLDNLPEDARKNFTELASKYGMPVEEHDIVTIDGYVLKTFRIPGNRTRPVLLAHGIFGTSDVFIARGNTSLCSVLFNEGHDIWLLNLRGNRYSRSHINLDPDRDKSFWDFSIHEHGISDLSSNIDYILNATGQPKLTIIGISEGTTVTFILTTTKPEYNSRIMTFIALAPVVYLQNLEPPSSIAMQFSSELIDLFRSIGIEELFGYKSAFKRLYNIICSRTFGYEFCLKSVLFLFTGADEAQMEPDFFRATIGQFPDGTSLKNMGHYAQIGRNKRFAHYDYGPRQNIVRYNTTLPPLYDLNKVLIDTYLVCGRNDKMSTLKDVEILVGKLPNVREFRVMTSEQFNHLDYIWAKDAHKVTYPFILTVLSKYNT